MCEEALLSKRTQSKALQYDIVPASTRAKKIEEAVVPRRRISSGEIENIDCQLINLVDMLEDI